MRFRDQDRLNPRLRRLWIIVLIWQRHGRACADAPVRTGIDSAILVIVDLGGTYS